MDMASIKQGLEALARALTAIKQAKDLLPDEKIKDDVVVAIENAEREMKIGESQTAYEMGYELCRDHFSPEIMLSADDQKWQVAIGEDTHP